MAAKRLRIRALTALMLLTVPITLAACTSSVDRRLVEGAVDEVTESPFYTLPSPVPAGKPGDIIRTEKLSSAPDGSIGWRVLYHTTDVTGANIIASGVIVAPDAPAPAGGRTVVGWGHPTTGATAKCAPSNGIDPFDLIEGLRALLTAGYVVAAADFPGMGVQGPNSYLIGQSEGNSVLDAIRAAQNMPDTGTMSSDDVLLWGHSQGGQAVLSPGRMPERTHPNFACARWPLPHRPPISAPSSTTTFRMPRASRSARTRSPPTNPSMPQRFRDCPWTRS